MRIIFIGTVNFSRRALERLIELKADIAGVLTRADSKFNADFCDLSQLCIRNNIPYRYFNDINSSDTVHWVTNLRPDIVFCFGLSQILRKDILKSAPMGVLGYHPARLPENRGRHPLIWALALGLERTASTFFFMDDGIDSGDILSQKDITIDYHDDARTLYDKINDTALGQIEDFLPKLKDNSYLRIAQDDKLANYWRKRDKEDGAIDFRMSSRAVYNLIRALTKPYAGAHLVYKNKEIKIWEAREANCKLKNIEHGKVLDIVDNQVLVKCFDNTILLTRHEFETLPKIGEYL